MTLFVRNKHGVRLFVLCLAWSISSACQSTEAPQDWKTECIGRYQISLPGDVEIATVPLESFPVISLRNPIKFEDGSSAAHSAFHYEGRFFVGQVASREKFKAIVNNFQKRQDGTIKSYIQEGDKESAKQLYRVPLNHPDAYAWVAGRSVKLYFLRDGRFFTWSDVDISSPTYNREMLYSILDNFRSRKLFEKPKSQGVCIPFGFIADNGQGWRSVAVRMRLKEHPDVEILFKDQMVRPDVKSDINMPEDREATFFWEKNNQGEYEELSYDWPKFKSVKLDGRNGIHTTVRLKRADGARDFGYLALVNGDPKAETDTPNLMLHVIRTGSRAKGEPVTEGEMKKMARIIAASIKRHH